MKTIPIDLMQRTRVQFAYALRNYAEHLSNLIEHVKARGGIR